MMSTWLFLCLLLTVISCESCDPGWSEYRGSCYYMSLAKLTWHQAELHCMSHGGHLVSMASLGTHEMLNNMKHEELVWVTPEKEDVGLNVRTCEAWSQQADFERFNAYDTIDYLLEHPEDADGVNTFYYGIDADTDARDRCEAYCQQNPVCAAYTYYAGLDSLRPTWWQACVGRTDIEFILKRYQYGLSGLRIANRGSLVKTSCWQENMFVCQKTAM